MAEPKRVPQTLTFDGEEYDVISPTVNAASAALVHVYNKLGRPDDPFSQAGQKMMQVIISVWEDLYASEAKEWYAMRTEYKNNEMTTREQSHKQTGRSLASIPSPIYRMMQKIFTNYKMNRREDFIKLVEYYPMFQMANKV